MLCAAVAAHPLAGQPQVSDSDALAAALPIWQKRFRLAFTQPVKLLPLDDQSDLILTTMYIDEANFLIRKASTTTKENGTYDMEMQFGKYAEWGLPDKVIFSFNTKDYKLPKGITLEYDDGSKKPELPKTETREREESMLFGNLNDRVAIVTGSGANIGEACARALAGGAAPAADALCSCCGSACRYTAMARASASLRYCVLRNTTSAMGPSTEPCGATPVFSKATTSSVAHSFTPASCAALSAGAYQFCTGISPPVNALASLVAPSALRGVWQAVQWPRPLTR